MKGTNQWGFAAFLGNISVSQLSTNAMGFFLLFLLSLMIPWKGMLTESLCFLFLKWPDSFPNIVYTVAVSIIDDFFSCTFPVTLHFVYIIQSSFGVCRFFKNALYLKIPHSPHFLKYFLFIKTQPLRVGWEESESLSVFSLQLQFAAQVAYSLENVKLLL